MIASSKSGFISSKVLLGLASAGVVSFAWWMMGDTSNENLSIQPLLEEVASSEFVLNK